MPWNNNAGGGGWKGGGGGPWGSGPQQRGSQPPDLEELLRRSQDRLRNILPSGGRGNVSIAILIVAALVVLWLVKCVYTVQPDELGQELVFGKPKDEVSTQGLHFHFWPVETVEKVSTRVQREFIGSDDDNRRTPAEGNLMLSADQNIVEINFSVLWRVNDPKKFLFSVNEPAAFLRRIVRKRHARAGRALDRRAGAHRAPRRGRGRRARAGAGHARNLQRRHIDRRRAARTRRPADRGGRRLRRGAARAAGSRPLPARSRAIRQPAPRRRARRGGADQRAGDRLPAADRGGSAGRVAALRLRARRNTSRPRT